MATGAAFEEVAEQAELLNKRGDGHYFQGDVLAAIDAYTEAIEVCPGVAEYYTNRAFCHLTMRTDWAKVEDDCWRAIQLDRDSVRGHYLLGLAFLKGNENKFAEAIIKELEKSHYTLGPALLEGNDHKIAEAIKELEKGPALLEGNEPNFAEAIKELEKALDLAKNARHYGVEDMEQSLERAKCSRKLEIWRYCESLVAKDVRKRFTTERSLDEATKAHLKEMEAVRQGLLKDDPHHLRCPITGEIFREPVTAPTGFSYERTAILRWLQQDRRDPMTRRPLEASQLIPNKAMREAVEAYLAEHGRGVNDYY